MNTKIELKKVSNELVKEYNVKFDKENKEVENAIFSLIKKFRSNKKIENVYLKAPVINALYKTNIFDIAGMAWYIHKLDIDNSLKKGDINVVEKITKAYPKKRFYSFATKYCAFHEPKKYSLYDWYVAKILSEYQKNDNFYKNKFTLEDLRIYSKFFSVINAFKSFYKLNKFSYKEIDKFLWQYAKEKFG